MNELSHPQPLDTQSLAHGVTLLGQVDPHLARIAGELGPPPLWARASGFATLVHIILEQQVSLASARAAFEKLRQADGLTPAAFLRFDDAELKTIGFSRQKAGYCRGLAEAILHREIDLEALAALDDAPARAALVAVKGIGPWTADIYLLMVLLRPDIWPSGDLALATAMQEVKGLPTRPNPQEMEQIARPWRPWRAVAARLLWHHYLSRRDRQG
jgi:DNA-3-methyladenine glycosylase II